jgi:hypothetical protein
MAVAPSPAPLGRDGFTLPLTAVNKTLTASLKGCRPSAFALKTVTSGRELISTTASQRRHPAKIGVKASGYAMACNGTGDGLDKKSPEGKEQTSGA